MGRLLVQVAIHLARVGRKADRRIDVADVAHRVAHQAIHRGRRQLGAGGDLARDHRQVRRHQRLAGNAAQRIGGQTEVQDSVANLVGHLIRMAHGDRLAREEIPVRAHGIYLMEKKGAPSAPFPGLNGDYKDNWLGMAIGSGEWWVVSGRPWADRGCVEKKEAAIGWASQSRPALAGRRRVLTTWLTTHHLPLTTHQHHTHASSRSPRCGKRSPSWSRWRRRRLRATCRRRLIVPMGVSNSRLICLSERPRM